MNNENFDLVTSDENEEFAVEFGEVINDGGTFDYNELENKPQINGHTLEGNKTGEQLDLQDKINDLNTIRSGATKGATAVQPGDLATVATSGSYNDLTNKPKINNVELVGNKSLNDLGIQPAGNYLTEETDPTVPSYVKNITQANITSWNNKSDFSGNYNDLTNKPTIPSEVTETTVSNWGFTKNTGTITGITMNGASKGTSGVVDLGTVITSHQDISGKLDTSKVKNANSTTAGDVYDVTYINTMIGDVESILTTLTTGSGV